MFRGGAGANGAASITSGTIDVSATGSGFSSGTAANPSLGWSADSDGSGTGFYRTVANAIGASCNGGEIFRFQASVLTAFTTLSLGAGSAFGFIAGTGGTITQGTSKATGVTLNTQNGQITLNSASLAASTAVAFTLTNSAIPDANAFIVLNHVSAGTAGAYSFTSTPATGSTVITVRNLTAGALAEAIVIQFAVIRGSVS